VVESKTMIRQAKINEILFTARPPIKDSTEQDFTPAPYGHSHYPA